MPLRPTPDAVDALRPRYDALLAALQDHACRPLEEDSQESAALARSEEARLTRESASIAAELQAAKTPALLRFPACRTSFPEPHRITTSPYAAVSIGLAIHGSLSVHQNPGPRLIRVALDPGPNRRQLNVPGSVTLRLNGRPYRSSPGWQLHGVGARAAGCAGTDHSSAGFPRPGDSRGARRRTTAGGNNVAAPQTCRAGRTGRPTDWAWSMVLCPSTKTGRSNGTRTSWRRRRDFLRNAGEKGIAEGAKGGLKEAWENLKLW